MANVVPFSASVAQLNSLSQLPIIKQLVFMLVVAAGIALGTSSVMWSTSPNMTPLYMDLAAQDANDIVAALEQQGTEFTIDNRTGLVSVPSSEIQQVRMQLASEGLPRSNSRGYGILDDEQSLGTSNFLEQARYNRALEQELVATIQQIQGVRSARVHVSIPKQSSFLRSGNQASASVMIDLVNPLALSDRQLSGILHLVTSSVSGLSSENVSVVDQRGTLLTQNGSSVMGGSSEKISYTRQIEQDYSRRIIDILTPIVGAGNVRTQVSADIDYTSIETTEEVYNPNNTAIRSEQSVEETVGSTNSAIVVPGTLAANAPVEQPAGGGQDTSSVNNQERTNLSRNYEIDRSVSLIRRTPGNITKLSVAVLVDLNLGQAAAGAEADADAPAVDLALEQARIDRITQLVQDAIGYDATRGDSVNIINEQFLAVPELAPIEEPPIWEQSWLLSALKQAGAGIIVLLLIFVVLRPAMKAAVIVPGQLTSASGQGVSGGNVTLTGESPNALLANKTPSQSPYEENLFRAQTLVQNEPAKAARMIQNWLANE
jgi:flagellar M-ring protein FliF